MSIYDNISGDNLATALKGTLRGAKRADFCIGYFNLRGWDLLLESVDALPGGQLDERALAKASDEDDNTYKVRILIGMQKHPQDDLEDFYALKKKEISNERAAKLKKEMAVEFRKQLTIGRPNNKDEATLKKLSRQLKSKQVVVKLHLAFQLHAKLYLAYREDYSSPIVGYLGSSNLTFAGLSKQGELNTDVTEKDSGRRLETWFQDRWDDQYSVDITAELAKVIDASWASEIPLKPYFVYMKIAYHLSQEARAGLAEFSVPKSLRKVLLPFQQNAVQVAARHRHKRGGVMIGDVVGLGKTIIATALAKMFEDDFGYQTLIISPPNLQEMWKGYKLEYGLRAEIMSLGEVQNKLKNTRPFRMVTIDESHNLRNREGRRYRAIHEYLYQAGSKVILLTATPYNKSYLDMGSQLRLFMDENGDQNTCSTCFVTGAGFSVPAKLPVQSTLLQNISDGTAAQELEDIQGIFNHKEAGGIFKKVALEDVFTFLDKIIKGNEYISGFDVDKAYKAKRRLITYFIKSINRALESLHGEDKYRYFFNSIVKRKLGGETNTIITFNWDTIPDFYINRGYKERGEKGGVDYGCYDWDWDDKDTYVPSMLRKPKGYSTVKALKLHGSINWAYSRKSGELYVKEQVSGNPEGLIIEDDDRYKEYDYIFMTPTFIKDLSNVHTKLIWHNAGFDLAGAKRIVFLGCSLPQADYEARYLLLKTAVQNKSDRIRVLIYPDSPEEEKKATKQRFETLFNGAGSH